MKETIICDKPYFCAHTFWGPVIVSAIIGVGLSFLLSLLSISFGFIAFSPNSSGELAFSASGFIALTVLSVISMFFIGWLASYLGREAYLFRYAGELYGLGTWSLTLIISIVLASSTGKFITNYEHAVNHSLGTTTVGTTVAAHFENRLENRMSSEKSTIEKKADVAGMTTFAVFFLFLIGGLSSCLGGRVARHWSPYTRNPNL